MVAGMIALTFILIPYRSGAQATLTGLGTAPGSTHTYATDISDDGSVVVGYSVTYYGEGEIITKEAVRWTAATGFVPLRDPTGGHELEEAAAASADGSIIVGRASSGAFRWTAVGGIEALGFGYATDVSPDGNVVVGWGDFASGSEAVRWTGPGGVMRLGDLPGGSFQSYANGVAADGSVVVGASSSASGSEAFRWTAAGGMVGLGDLLGGTFWSNARAVSADGAVVVGVGSSASGYEAFRWTASGGMQGLGGLESGATDVSADGSIVVGGAEEAFIWDPAHGMRSLRQVIAAGGADVSGWRLGYAIAVSADGHTIVGEGSNVSGGQQPWIAHLEPPQCDDGLDNDGDGHVDLDDPACPTPSFGPENPQCDDGLDNDGDGLVDADDRGCLAPFLAREDPPCDDGIDNDGDGAIDSADSSCPYWGEGPPPCGLGVELAGAIPLLIWLHRNRGRSRKGVRR